MQGDLILELEDQPFGDLVEEMEEEPVARSATLDIDDDDGMHEVEDDEEPEIDFAEDTGELGADDSEDEEDER